MRQYSDIAKDLTPDGALRDFYVDHIAQCDWDAFLAHLRSSDLIIKFSLDGIDTKLPSSTSEIFSARIHKSPLLKIYFYQFQVNCHFFSQDQLELDFHPADVKGEKEWIILREFFQDICNLLDKAGKLTHENSENEVIEFIIPKAAQQGDAPEPASPAR